MHRTLAPSRAITSRTGAGAQGKFFWPGGLLVSLLAACGAGGETGGREPELSHVRFADVTDGSGIEVVNVSGDPRRWYIPESNGCGAAWLDYEGDGDMDLFVANGRGMKYVDGGTRLETFDGPSSRFYRNEGKFKFTDVSHAVGAARNEWINGVATGDIDNDGDTDLYLACLGEDVFLRKDITFAEVTEASGLRNEYWGTGPAFGDANRDGNLDLYVANYCLFDFDHPPNAGKPNVIDGVAVAFGPEGENGRGINPGAPDVFFFGNGRGNFGEATAAAGLELKKDLCSYASVFSDIDADGWVDILVSNDLQPCNLFMNTAGHFTDEAIERGFAFNADGSPTSAMGLFVEDIEGDGDFDVLRTNFDLEANSLHINDGKGNFTERGKTYGIAAASLDRLSWGGGFFDADLDGYLDILIANGHVFPQAEEIGMHAWAQGSQVYRGLPHRRFGIEWEDISEETGGGLAALRSARGVALGDIDDDGDTDAIIIDIDSSPRLLENQSLHAGRWIGIKTIGKRSNRDGFGAKVTVQAGKRRWVREIRSANGLYSAHDPRLLIGLGMIDAVDYVEVNWPSGGSQTLKKPDLDRLHVIVESSGAR
ncbi:MAG: hypothetical protein CMJ89_10180 [Planctomycetes bacterium]|nr:hypothetical protein [Planctomycetota bacterium]